MLREESRTARYVQHGTHGKRPEATSQLFQFFGPARPGPRREQTRAEIPVIVFRRAPLVIDPFGLCHLSVFCMMPFACMQTLATSTGNGEITPAAKMVGRAAMAWFKSVWPVH